MPTRSLARTGMGSIRNDQRLPASNNSLRIDRYHHLPGHGGIGSSYVSAQSRRSSRVWIPRLLRPR